MTFRGRSASAARLRRSKPGRSFARSVAGGLSVLLLLTTDAGAHRIGHEGETNAAYDPTVKPPLAEPGKKPSDVAGASTALPAAAFLPFAPKVATRTDGRFFYVESDGLPDHRMMVGIKAWQQQVPLPQAYFGANAWRFPLRPVEAANPLSARTHFFRGAIAIAANGVPIFNPIKNDGQTDTYLAGELDEYGGHAGRADDYHYHIAPVHLAKVLGPALPQAYALDGYAIYGYAEPDGSAPGPLDAFNGHSTAALGYHYHATKGYPYLNGGFHGEVVEKDGQVDPQPRAQGLRPAARPLPGAVITGFSRTSHDAFALKYEVGGKTHDVNYEIGPDRAVTFTFVDGEGHETTEKYGAPEPRGERPPPQGRDNPPPRPEAEADGNPPRQPWMKVHAREMDRDGDGRLTSAEVTMEVVAVFAGYDGNHDLEITREEYEKPGGVRSPMGGYVKQHAREIDADGDGSLSKAELEAIARKMFEKSDTNRDGELSREELVLPPGYVVRPPGGPADKPPSAP